MSRGGRGFFLLFLLTEWFIVCTSWNAACVLLKLRVREASWKNNQWKKNAFVMNFDHACETLKTHGRFLRDFMYLPGQRGCPLPKVRERAQYVTL